MAKKISPWVIGGAAVGGLGLGYMVWKIMTRTKLSPEESVETMEAVAESRGTPPQTTREPNTGRRIKRIPPTVNSSGGRFASGGAKLRVTLAKPKFIISYDPAGTNKHGSSWDSHGRLRKMWDPGQIISMNKATKFFDGPDLGNSLPIWGQKRVRISPLQDFNKWFTQDPVGHALGADPPGNLSPKYGGWDKTMDIGVAPGAYYISPDSFPVETWRFKAPTKYWAFTNEGPVIKWDPWSSHQPELAKEAIKQFLADDCTNWWTHVKITTASSILRSGKSIQIKEGETKSVTVRPYVLIGISKHKTKDPMSIALGTACELTSKAVQYWLSNIAPGAIGKAADLLLSGQWKFW